MQKELTIMKATGVLGLMVVVGAMASFFSVDAESRRSFEANVFNFATAGRLSQEEVVDSVDAYTIPAAYADEVSELNSQEPVQKTKVKRSSSQPVVEDPAAVEAKEEEEVAKVKRYVEE